MQADPTKVCGTQSYQLTKLFSSRLAQCAIIESKFNCEDIEQGLYSFFVNVIRDSDEEEKTLRLSRGV